MGRLPHLLPTKRPAVIISTRPITRPILYAVEFLFGIFLNMIDILTTK